MKRDFLEEDMDPPLRAYFESAGWLVRAEVRSCDLVLLKDEFLGIVEMKKGLTLELVAQSARRLRVADMVWMAVPKPARLRRDGKWRDIVALVRRLELGLILVSGTTDVVEVVAPVPFDAARSRKLGAKERQRLLAEAKARTSEYHRGGQRGKKLATAYRRNAVHAALVIAENGPASPKELRERGVALKQFPGILLNDPYGWFVRLSRAVYDLSPAGREALSEWAELAAELRRHTGVKS